MRPWRVIAISGTAATIVALSLCLPAELPGSRADLIALLYTQGSALAAVWFGSYGVAALALTTVALAIEVGDAKRFIANPALESADLSFIRRQSSRNGLQRYLISLAITQYFSVILALLAMGFAGIPIDEPWFGSFFPLVANSPALAAAVALVFAGFGAFAFVLLRVRSALRFSIKNLELALLQDIAEMLRNRAAEAARIEQVQRSILGTMKDLATVVNRFGRSQRLIIQEIKDTVGPEALNQWIKTAEAWPPTIEHATSELRATLSALDVSIARLAEIAASVPSGDARSLSHLSTEFGKLLHDIDETDNSGIDSPG